MIGSLSPIPHIFWVTLGLVLLILGSATLIGRSLARCLPHRLQPAARSYLAPALGFAQLTVVAAIVGRVLPLGLPFLASALTLTWVVVSLYFEPRRGKALLHALVVGAFGLLCGVSILAPLFVSGAFNAHNDAFTYLAHSEWLQSHAFSEIVTAKNVTPLSTQIALYQQDHLRMGASFLLAFFQAAFHMRWPYEVLPAVSIGGITAVCLGIGHALSPWLMGRYRSIAFFLLAMPALSLGGIVFGPNFGFLPQTFGLAFAASFLFLGGAVLVAMRRPKSTFNLLRLATVCAVLFAAVVYAYSEIAPFVFLAFVFGALYGAIRKGAWANTLKFGLIASLVAVTILNYEVIRAILAIKGQSGVVVGSPVDWTLLGFVAHAFGLHGGAWDPPSFQWASSNAIENSSFWYGATLVTAIATSLAICAADRRSSLLRHQLKPSLVMVALCLGLAVFFRYAVPSPFPIGTGQSWSQFKLSDWSQPFLLPFMFSVPLMWRRSLLQWPGKLAFSSLLVMLTTASAMSAMQRISPLMASYPGVKDLAEFYREIPEAIRTACPSTDRVFLDLRTSYVKLREIALLYTDSHHSASDWTDDGYLFPRLPQEKRIQRIQRGDCIVEPNNAFRLVDHGDTVGPLHVGIYEGGTKMKLEAVENAYAQEGTADNWWYWIKDRIAFTLMPILLPSGQNAIRVRFDYVARETQTLTVRVQTSVSAPHSSANISAIPGAVKTFDGVLYANPLQRVNLIIETNAQSTALGNGDPRSASFMIRNLKVEAADDGTTKP